MTNVVVESYSGSNIKIAQDFATRSAVLADDGYVPISQSWAPNSWGLIQVIVAVLMCFIILGIPVLLSMLADPPSGTLTVCYKKS